MCEGFKNRDFEHSVSTLGSITWHLHLDWWSRKILYQIPVVYGVRFHPSVSCLFHPPWLLNSLQCLWTATGWTFSYI